MFFDEKWRNMGLRVSCQEMIGAIGTSPFKPQAGRMFPISMTARDSGGSVAAGEEARRDRKTARAFAGSRE